MNAESTTTNAKQHFMAVASGDIPAAIRYLDGALDEGFILMHRRAYGKLSDAKNKFLGRDTHQEQINAEWDALTPDQQKAIESDPKGYGKFGMFDSVSRKEVPLALTVAAKLLSKQFNVDQYCRKLLSDPEMVQRITTRFPLITAEDIQEALKLE